MKTKSPLIKRLRKAGYSTSESMAIYFKALDNYKELRPHGSIRNFNMLARRSWITYMFVLYDSKEGSEFWFAIVSKLRRINCYA